jgi:hypothetical protein
MRNLIAFLLFCILAAVSPKLGVLVILFALVGLVFWVVVAVCAVLLTAVAASYSDPNQRVGTKRPTSH